MINTKKDRPDFGLKSVTSSLRKKIIQFSIRRKNYLLLPYSRY